MPTIVRILYYIKIPIMIDNNSDLTVYYNNINY